MRKLYVPIIDSRLLCVPLIDSKLLCVSVPTDTFCTKKRLCITGTSAILLDSSLADIQYISDNVLQSIDDNTITSLDLFPLYTL